MNILFRSTLILCSIHLTACQYTPPKDLLKPDPNVLATRALQTRSYDTRDEKKILSASAGALQDMGFTIDDSETKLGLIVASKKADATNKAQVALATTAMLAGALSGQFSPDPYYNLDDVQKVRASLVTHINAEKKQTFLRITFQRVVWNKGKQIVRCETLKDENLYRSFFDKLSKSVFLEEHQI